MRLLYWKWAKAVLFQPLLGCALLGVIWLGGRFLPSVIWIKAAAGIAAAALALVQAQLYIEAVSATHAAGYLGGPRWTVFLGFAPPAEISRAALRVCLIALWAWQSQPLAGFFLSRLAGGDAALSTLRNLGSLRGAVTRYRIENHGTYPPNLDSLAASLPPAWSTTSDYARSLLPHQAASGVEYYGNESCRGATNANLSTITLRDTGRWGYVKDPKSACWGRVFVDCTHTDFRGRLWANY